LSGDPPVEHLGVRIVDVQLAVALASPEQVSQRSSPRLAQHATQHPCQLLGGDPLASPTTSLRSGSRMAGSSHLTVTHRGVFTAGCHAVSASALSTLLCDHIVVGGRGAGRWRRGYINGNHRAQAMLDAGVRRTITVSWRVPTR
jgi:hypothetical protein